MRQTIQHRVTIALSLGNTLKSMLNRWKSAREKHIYHVCARLYVIDGEDSEYCPMLSLNRDRRYRPRYDRGGTKHVRRTNWENCRNHVVPCRQLLGNWTWKKPEFGLFILKIGVSLLFRKIYWNVYKSYEHINFCKKKIYFKSDLSLIFITNK